MSSRRKPTGVWEEVCIYSTYFRTAWVAAGQCWNQFDQCPQFFSNFEIHLEDCGVASDWVMRRGKVKLNFRGSVWPLIAVYQQHDQRVPRPVSASWCSESNVWGITGKPVSIAPLWHCMETNKPHLWWHTVPVPISCITKGQERTNASFYNALSWVSRVTTTFRERTCCKWW